ACKTVTHVTNPRLFVDGLDLRAGLRPNRRKELVEARATAPRHVDHATRGARCTGRKNIGLHGIRYEREVPGLLPIPIDPGRLTVEASADKARDHRRILALGILPRTKDVEVPKRHGLEAIELVVEPAVDLSRVFLERIRREGYCGHAFHLGESLRVAVGRRRCGKHHTSNAHLARRFEDEKRSIDVYAV